MSSYAHLSLDRHLHALQPDQDRDQLRRSRSAADRYAVLQAVRAQRTERRAARRSVSAVIGRLLPGRPPAERTTSPAR